MTHPSAQAWITKLQLAEHIEGGWYHENYRSELNFDQLQLPASFTGSRSACTHIYFLLLKDKFSAFHRIKSDELWHFYDGDPLVIYELDEQGTLTEHPLGPMRVEGHLPFAVIRAGSWFASRVSGGGEYGLVGCTVVPGFDFEDFELAKADLLAAKYPAHEKIIRSLSR